MAERIGFTTPDELTDEFDASHRGDCSFPIMQQRRSNVRFTIHQRNDEIECEACEQLLRENNEVIRQKISNTNFDGIRDVNDAAIFLFL
jgi:hypothetical protein